MRTIIEEIQIVPIKPRFGLVALASLVLDRKIYLGSIGIYTKLNGTGFRITYPTKKAGIKNFNIYHPISKELSEEINKKVLKKAEEILTT